MERAMALQLRLSDCHRIIEHSTAFANERWVSGTSSFRDVDSQQGGVNIVNTSTAILVIGRCRHIFDFKGLDAYSGMEFKEVCEFYTANYNHDAKYWPSKETASWTPYVTSYVMGAIARSASLAQEPDVIMCIREVDKLKDILAQEAAHLIEYLETWSKQSLQTAALADYDHVYFAYTAFEALEALRKQLKRAASDLFPEDKFLNAAKSAIHRFRFEFFSQMTFKLAALPQHLDIVSLALSMYALVAHGVGVYEIPDDVLDAALDTVFSVQEKTGLWNTATPLLGAATGRIGCSSIELANCLLRIPRVEKRFDQFYQYFDLLFIHLQRGFDSANPKRGWAVDIRRNGDRRQTWYSFYAFEFLDLFSSLIESHAAQLILRGFQYGKDLPKYSWKEIGDYESFKDRIDKSIVLPRAQGGPASAQKCSMILFGPPGTGKTSIAGALAHKLGWGLIEVGPSDFLKDGLDGIFAQGDLIFQRLLLLKRVVVLFDEIDELVRNREEDEDKMSRFLTTYMLPWIQRLRERASIVFIFATNYIKVFDPAIKRVGRFDLVLPIGPPQGSERARIMGTMGLDFDQAGLSSLATSIPAQATIGEISMAVGKLKSNGQPIAQPALIGQLNADSLLIKQPDWEEFLKDSNTYSRF